MKRYACTRAPDQECCFHKAHTEMEWADFMQCCWCGRMVEVLHGPWKPPAPPSIPFSAPPEKKEKK